MSNIDSVWLSHRPTIMLRKLFPSQVDTRLAIILLIVFVNIVGAGMALPILPLFAEQEFALSAQWITILSASFFAAQFIAGPWLGQLSDRYGRIPVLVASQLGTVVSFMMLGAAPNIAWLFAARVLDGITGGNIIVAQAYVTDITPAQKRTQSLGLVFSTFGLGFIFGPTLGGLLGAWLGARAPFYVAAGISLIPAILTGWFLPETITAEKRQQAVNQPRPKLSVSQILKNQSLLLVLLMTIGAQFALGILQSTFSLYGKAVLFAGQSPERVRLGVGLLLGVVGFGQFLTQVAILRPMLRRFGDAGTAVVGIVVRVIGLVLIALASEPMLAALSSLFFAAGQGLMMPPLQSLATRTVPDNQRGAVLGASQSAVSLSTIFSQAIAGSIFAASVHLPYWLGALITACMLLPAMALLRKFPQQPFPKH
ncbi:MAG TPA: MFS transporter [Anaerolineales bacterium]|nr:MFS transporter [Anaerolineales bacterium]